MNLIGRAILAIVGVWLVWSQLGQLTMMINTHSINVLGLVLLVVGILLLLFAIKPNFLRTKRWWQFWK
jgi:formate hydrogenlyase subunit 3/multisubunit Na+/H+ antiporter MnhD subunit